ncbi:MAG: hypothetical protein ABWX81_04255, partial [Pseudolabrys sp.]
TAPIWLVFWHGEHLPRQRPEQTFMVGCPTQQVQYLSRALIAQEPMRNRCVGATGARNCAGQRV